LARAKRLCLKDVAEESFVTYPADAGSHLRTAVDAVWAHARLRPRIVMESGWSQTLLCLVAAGTGLTILPKELQKRGIEGIKFVTLHPAQVPLHLGITWRKGGANLFVNSLLAVAEECFSRMDTTVDEHL